jgi:hypothetical protein
MQSPTAATDFATEPWIHCKGPTNAFPGLRFGKRDIFKEKLEEWDLKRVQREEARIEQLRASFAVYETNENC